MKVAQSKIFQAIESLSRYLAGFAAIIFLTFKLLHVEIAISIQIVVALLALMVGIPHGAIDHLIAIPSRPQSQRMLYMAIYTLVAIFAGWLIAIWNLWGFRAILIMSALHFGFGDASYRNEWRELNGGRKAKLISETLYAIPAGFVPVLLPLTDKHVGAALHRIRPNLGLWAGSFTHEIRIATMTFSLLSILGLLLMREFSFALDLFLLLTLASVAPPLITFAIYFGLWHATRHTARITLKLPSAVREASNGRIGRALWVSIFPGLYAVAGVLVLAAALMFLDRAGFSSGLLWSVLVVIWALTVPHMLTTSRFDLKALKN